MDYAKKLAQEFSLQELQCMYNECIDLFQDGEYIGMVIADKELWEERLYYIQDAISYKTHQNFQKVGL